MSSHPFVRPGDAKVLIGSEVLATSLFFVNNQGVPITQYRFRDLNGFQGGTFVVNGNQVLNSDWFQVDDSEINQVFFRAALGNFTETIQIQAFNGTFWSNIANISVYTGTANNTAPVLTVQRGVTLENERLNVFSILNYFDADNDPVVRYRMIDNRSDTVGGGYFVVNGVTQTQSQWFYFTSRDNVEYVAAPGQYEEGIRVRAFDGVHWTAPVNSSIFTQRNANRPVVALADKIVRTREMMSIHHLFDAYDEDGNTLKSYSFRDTHELGGHLLFQGQMVAPKTWLTITEAQLDQLFFVGASDAWSENLFVRVNDGKWNSNLGTINITSYVPPGLEVPDLLVAREQQSRRLRNLITVNENSLPIRNVQVFAPHVPVGGPLLRVDNTLLENGQVHQISWEQFQDLYYVGGASFSFDVGRYLSEMSLRFEIEGFANGTGWSPWERIDTITEVVGSRALQFGRWGFFAGQPVEVTYSFPRVVPSYYEEEDFPYVGESAEFNGLQRQRVRDAFEIISSFSNITFREVFDGAGGAGGMMRFMFTQLGENELGRTADLPLGGFSSWTTEGDVWLSLDYFANSEFVPGSMAWSVLLHEIGHGIGLKHPYEGPIVLPSETNNVFYSAMAYTDAYSALANTATAIHPTVFSAEAPDQMERDIWTDDFEELDLRYELDTPMFYDILEIQRLYGSSEFQNDEDTVYSWSNRPFREVIRDTGGVDTIDASNFNTNQLIDLRPGRFSNIGQNERSLFLTYDTRIENAIGGPGNDHIIGNQENNRLVGGSGDDILEGRGGNNLLMGGPGNDRYVWRFGDGWSVIDEDRGAGRDEIHVFGNHSAGNVPFGTINELENDFLFRRLGRDLRIDFTIDRGDSIGGFTIRDQAWGGSRVETLRFFGLDGQQIGGAVSLVSIFSQLTDVGQHFRLTDIDSPLGFLATPA